MSRDFQRRWIKLRAKDDAGNKEIQDAIVKNCDCRDICIECIFEKDWSTYCTLLYKYGQDRYDRTCQKWLKESKKSGL